MSNCSCVISLKYRCPVSYRHACVLFAMCSASFAAYSLFRPRVSSIVVVPSWLKSTNTIAGSSSSFAKDTEYFIFCGDCTSICKVLSPTKSLTACSILLRYKCNFFNDIYFFYPTINPSFRYSFLTSLLLLLLPLRIQQLLHLSINLPVITAHPH